MSHDDTVGVTTSATASTPTTSSTRPRTIVRGDPIAAARCRAMAPETNAPAAMVARTTPAPRLVSPRMFTR
ncbi:hypothetical protein D3C74_411660 [compost metagenome]